MNNTHREFATNRSDICSKNNCELAASAAVPQAWLITKM
jgi:hypothetical protein